MIKTDILENKIIYTTENWEEYVDINNEIGKNKGQNSRVFLSKFGNVFKKLNKNLSTDSSKVDIYFLLLGLKSDLFILPTNLVIKDNQLIGYFMEYKDYATINNLLESVKIQDMLNDINRVKSEVYILSNNQVKVWDIHSRDIYFSDKFYIGDIDAFKMAENDNPNDIFNSNIKTIYNGFLAGIFTGVFLEYYYLVKMHKDLNELSLGLVEGNENPIDFEIFISKICEKLNLDVSTVTIGQLRCELRNYIQNIEASISR